MKHIAARHGIVTAAVDRIDRDPTAAELDAIDLEMAAIRADVELIDAQIIALNNTPNEVDVRRVRRAFGRVLEERRALANRTADTTSTGGAA